MQRAQQDSEVGADAPLAGPASGSSGTLARAPYHIPKDNAVANYAKTKRQLYSADKQEVDRLYHIMDDRFDYLIRKEVERKKDKGQADSGNPRGFGKTSWSLPSHIILFLQSSIQEIQNVKLRLQSWPEFKKIMFDVLDHRI